ncbi:hypothetical protein FIU87_05695 [Bacillus sp. THAF10]|uniref:hypothetical protein n=1 Tax=Bacillus sp. THAF10 TaxID=2587848 RepID=UPI00126849C6|nr:hypothetical protein [Bacillus sp. THAF10]QFT88125.1 hypothetical protein FIU87_05695 [Bacillus sp. THAF10]
MKEKVITLYKMLWNNRSMESGKAMDEIEMLHQAIRVELLDELTHPRTRKQPSDKYLLAMKRILHSPLKEAEQLALIREFTFVFEQIKKEG